MSALILLNDVKVAYIGRKPILDISRLLLKPGQVTVVAGPSGSGKSTLGHALAGLLPFLGARVEGTIQVGDTTMELHDRKAMHSLRGREIRWIPQEPGRAFTVTKPLLPQMLEGMQQNAKIIEQLARLLKVLGLPKPSELEGHYPFEFSGGMLQRAAVISAFLPRPMLVVVERNFPPVIFTPTSSRPETTEDAVSSPGAGVRADRTPVTCMLELYVYPRSHGRMLRHIGNDIHEVVKLLMGHRLHGWNAGICK